MLPFPARRSAAIVLAAIALASGVHAQNATPAEAAARLSGTWKVNRELSPGFRDPGQRRGGPGRGGAPAGRFSMAPGFAVQGRGGGGGGAGGGAPSSARDMTPDELAAVAAMRELQQIAEEITINASAERVTFTDARGERSYTIDGKNAKIMVGAAEVTVKSKWDKSTLKQEFSTTSTNPMASSKLTETWDVDKEGRLVLTAKLESLRLRTPDQKAVFDRK